MNRQLHQPPTFAFILAVIFLSCAPETDAQDIVLRRSGATCADDPELYQPSASDDSHGRQGRIGRTDSLPIPFDSGTGGPTG